MAGGRLSVTVTWAGWGTKPDAAERRLAADRETVGYGTVQRDVAQLG